MTAFSKAEENFIEHEVKIRLHDNKFDGLQISIGKLDTKLDTSINKLDDKLEKSIDRLDASIKHLDNKFMLMFSIVLGSIWLPAILHYLHVT